VCFGLIVVDVPGTAAKYEFQKCHNHILKPLRQTARITMTTRVTTATTVATMAIISPTAKPDELGVDVVITVGGFSEFVSGKVEDVIGISSGQLRVVVVVVVLHLDNFSRDMCRLKVSLLAPYLAGGGQG
jgi:hypothetical protein